MYDTRRVHIYIYIYLYTVYTHPYTIDIQYMYYTYTHMFRNYDLHCMHTHREYSIQVHIFPFMKGKPCRSTMNFRPRPLLERARRPRVYTSWQVQVRHWFPETLPPSIHGAFPNLKLGPSKCSIVGLLHQASSIQTGAWVQ